jgi:hypothetical protein
MLGQLQKDVLYNELNLSDAVISYYSGPKVHSRVTNAIKSRSGSLDNFRSLLRDMIIPDHDYIKSHKKALRS